MEQFCEIQVKKRYKKSHKSEEWTSPEFGVDIPSSEYFVSINYGDGNGWNWLLEKDNTEYTCDSQVQAMNYMAKQGWKMIKTFRDSDFRKYYVYKILFRRNNKNKF